MPRRDLQSAPGRRRRDAARCADREGRYGRLPGPTAGRDDAGRRCRSRLHPLLAARARGDAARRCRRLGGAPLADDHPTRAEPVPPRQRQPPAGRQPRTPGSIRWWAGRGGRIEEVDPDGDIVWRFDYADDEVMQHHDLEPLPNGNVLFIVWERIPEPKLPRPGATLRCSPPASCGPTRSWSTGPRPTRSCWEWRVWDHLVQDHDPAKPNYGDPAETRAASTSTSSSTATRESPTGTTSTRSRTTRRATRSCSAPGRSARSG